MIIFTRRNLAMKEKLKKGLRKFFEDWSLILLVVIVGVIAGKISYKNLLEENRLALNSYSKKAYDYLNEIAENIIVKGEGIAATELPPEVTEWNILYDGEKFSLIYCLNNNEGIKYAESARMEITFSKEGEILFRNSNFATEEKYVKNVKRKILSEAILNGFCVAVIVAIPIFIKEINYKNQKNENNLS